MSTGGNAQAHLTVVGALNIMSGSLVALVGLMLFTAAFAAGIPFIPFDLGAAPVVFMVFFGGGFLALGFLFIAAGLGLFGRRVWARIVVLVGAGLATLLALAALVELDLFGLLAFGGYAAYAFWALTRPGVAGQFAPAPHAPA